MLQLFKRPRKITVTPFEFMETFASYLKKSMDDCDGTQYTIQKHDGTKMVTFSCKQKKKINWRFWRRHSE